MNKTAGFILTAFLSSVLALSAVQADTSAKNAEGTGYRIHVNEVGGLGFFSAGGGMKLQSGTFQMPLILPCASDPNGCALTSVAIPPGFTSIRVYPNPWWVKKHASSPFITFDTLPAGSVINIYTVAGQWLKTLSPPADKITWDLTNDSGEKVASGIYVYLITSQGQKKIGQIIVIK